MKGIKQKTINNLAWSVSERVSLQIIHVIVSIIMARILLPSEFGLFGILTIFIGIAEPLVNSGFSSALIQKKDASQTDSTSIFYFNLIIGLFFSIVLFISSNFIAEFFNQPILKPITRLLSLTYTIKSLSIVQFTILKKELRFKNRFFVSIFGAIVSSLCGIIAAVAGFGVWSLVIQNLSQHITEAALVWVFNKWRPVGKFSINSLKSMFDFGSKILILGVIDSIFANFYQTFIGKVYSPSDVGYYSRANQMQSAASMATSTALVQVMFPAFSPYQDDKIILRKMQKVTIKMSMFLVMPMMVGVIIIAKPLILFLLTEKWAASISYFQLLCVIGIFYPINLQSSNLLKITGEMGLILKLDIFKYILTIILIFITYQHGIIMLIIGQIIVHVVYTIIVSHFAGKLIDYKLIDQFRDLLPIAIVSLVMGVIVFSIGSFNYPNNFFKISVQVLVGIIIYYLINLLLNSNELKETVDIFSNILKSLSAKLRKLTSPVN